MCRLIALPTLLMGLAAYAAEIAPGVLATYERLLTDERESERQRGLDSLAKNPENMVAVLAAFDARLAADIEKYRAGGAAKGKGEAVDRIKTAKDTHAAQKAKCGTAFPRAETLEDFHQLVVLHEKYWNELLAFFNSKNPEEDALRKLEGVVRMIHKAAGKGGDEIPSVEKVIAEALTPAQASLIAGEKAFLDECRRVYLWNDKHTPFAKDYERHALKVHNEYRIIHGLEPAELDEKLLDAATKHCAEMAKLKYFAHESPVAENKTWSMRIKNAGYSGKPGSENLATAGRAAMSKQWATQSFVMWFWDPHHNPLVNPKFRQLAVGFAPGFAGGSYGIPTAMHSANLDPNEFALSAIDIDHALYKKVFTERKTAGRR